MLYIRFLYLIIYYYQNLESQAVGNCFLIFCFDSSWKVYLLFKWLAINEFMVILLKYL